MLQGYLLGCYCPAIFIRKPSPEPNELKNYHPVSNLPFFKKIVEHVVKKHLNEHMSDNNLHETYQSAYKKLHCPETALVHVQMTSFVH